MNEFIHLKSGKQFSRLLYVNPVCFLCTERRKSESKNELNQSRQSNDFEDFQRNVMVLSWLTATNNNGKFMFSINKSRYSSAALLESGRFVLSIPVQGMEELTRCVGSVSGKHRDKFTGKRYSTEESNDEHPFERKKRHLFEKHPNGIQGLEAIPFTDWGFSGIQHCAAHLLCEAYHILEDSTVDKHHFVIFAVVKDAKVDPKYWDIDKDIFQPQAGVPRVLKFFGAQQFGYVGV